MKIYLVVLNPSCKIKPESWNPVLAVFSEDKKLEACELAESNPGYYTIERMLNENEFK